MKKKHPFISILTTKFKSKIILNLIKKEKIHKILDAGCGSGYMLSQLEDFYSLGIGIDMSPEAIKFGQQFTKAKLLIGNAESLNFKDNEFDCIISTDAFEHIPNDEKAMKEAFRVLNKDGFIIIYTPSEIGILSKTNLVDLYHKSDKSYLLDQRYYTIKSLSELARSAGFRVEYVRYHNIFFQELFTQLLKWISFKLGKKYEHQADIHYFTESKLFTIYRLILLPFMTFFIRAEEIIFNNFILGNVPGHRIVMKCRK